MTEFVCQSPQEAQLQNISIAFLDLLDPVSKLGIITEEGNVFEISRDLLRFASPLFNNILKDVPCCKSTVIIIPDVCRETVEHVISIVSSGVSNKSHMYVEDIKSIKETANMMQIELTNMDKEMINNISGESDKEVNSVKIFALVNIESSTKCIERVKEEPNSEYFEPHTEFKTHDLRDRMQIKDEPYLNFQEPTISSTLSRRQVNKTPLIRQGNMETKNEYDSVSDNSCDMETKKENISSSETYNDGEAIQLIKLNKITSPKVLAKDLTLKRKHLNVGVDEPSKKHSKIEPGNGMSDQPTLTTSYPIKKKSTQLECPNCKQNYGGNERDFNYHTSLNHNYLCVLCPLKFTYWNRLDKHFKLVHKNETVKDKISNEAIVSDNCNNTSFKQQGLCIKQKKEVHMISCFKCDSTFTNKPVLEEHLASMHGIISYITMSGSGNRSIGDTTKQNSVAGPRRSPAVLPPSSGIRIDGNMHHGPRPPPSPTSHTELKHLKSMNINPIELDLSLINARFFVVKSYSEEDIHQSIKYEIWCSTEHGNKRLDSAFKEREKKGPIYLFFSVNGSRHFCGMAQMLSGVDYQVSAGVWAQKDKFRGQFKVKWIYVKDVPNSELMHIRLENNGNRPVTNSRDTTEVTPLKGKHVLTILHNYAHLTSIFDDFINDEKIQVKKEVKTTEQNNGNSGGGSRDRRNDHDRHCHGRDDKREEKRDDNDMHDEYQCTRDAWGNRVVVFR